MNTHDKYIHDGDQNKPYLLIAGYTFGTHRVERWTYAFYGQDKIIIGSESDRYKSGDAALYGALSEVSASEYQKYTTS